MLLVQSPALGFPVELLDRLGPYVVPQVPPSRLLGHYLGAALSECAAQHHFDEGGLMISSIKHLLNGCDYQPIAGTDYQLLVCTYCRKAYVPEHWK